MVVNGGMLIEAKHEIQDQHNQMTMVDKAGQVLQHFRLTCVNHVNQLQYFLATGALWSFDFADYGLHCGTLFCCS